MKFEIIKPIFSMVFILGTATAALAETDAYRSATRVADIKKMGAQQIAGESIRKIVAGRTLTHPDWTWSFKPDGTQSSKANNGNWATKGTWKINGNQLCRTNAETGNTKCSDVYLLGRDLKFTEGGKRKLAKWHASY